MTGKRAVHAVPNTSHHVVAVCAVFALYYIGREFGFAPLFYALNSMIPFYPVTFPASYLLIGAPVFLYVYLANHTQMLQPLGLASGFIPGFIMALLCAMPMFVGYGVLNGFKVGIDWETFWVTCVFAAFFEELYYRGFFFGQLYRNTAFGFIPALVLSAFVFASLHLYQSKEPAVLVGIFLTTLMGAVLFAWLFVEWGYNLWLPIFLHFFMNLSWELFAVADNALGNWEANLIRGITVASAVIGTVLYKRHQGLPLAINRQTLISRANPPSLGSTR